MGRGAGFLEQGATGPALQVVSVAAKQVASFPVDRQQTIIQIGKGPQDGSAGQTGDP